MSDEFFVPTSPSEKPPLREAFSEAACPACHLIFAPFAGETAPPIQHADPEVACPRCQHRFPLHAGRVKAVQHVRGNPPGPFAKPADSRIEVAKTDGGKSFSLPSSGRSGGLLPHAIFWNLLAWPLALGVTTHELRHGTRMEAMAIWLLPAIGALLLGIALLNRFSSYVLTLTPETVRLRRTFLFSTTEALPTRAITSVRKVQRYVQSYQSVYTIQIQAGQRRIRFGTFLSGDEKNWLAYELRVFARQHGAPVEAEESTEAQGEA